MAAGLMGVAGWACRLRGTVSKRRGWGACRGLSRQPRTTSAALRECRVLREAVDAVLPSVGPAVIRLTSTDVYANLAFEEWLGSQEDLAQRGVLMLWINSPCIVVGRNQNAWHECDLGEMYTRGVKLARRLSGGGTVFHDLHNLNITFLSSRDAFSKESNSELLVRALNSAGAPTAAPTVSTNERTDLIVNGRKVSGSAYRLNGTTAYHHCTLLVGTDLTTLSNVLRPSLPSIVTKGIPSVRSPVCNLAEVGHLADMASILTLVETAYLDHHGTLAAAGHAAVLSATGLAEKSELLAARCRELQQWEWLCGTGPPFHVTFPLDDALGSTLTLHVKQGNVIRAEVQGRSSNDDEVVGDMLTATLAGTPFYGTHLLAALHNADTTTLSPATVAAAMDALGTVKFWNEIS